MSIGRLRCTDPSIQRRAGMYLTALLTLAVGIGLARPAEARRNGIVADSCNGCHGSGLEGATLTLVADKESFEPDESVTFTLTIEEPSIRVGGAFITALGLGTFETLAGEGLSVTSNGLVHTAPKAAADGAVTFRFVWQAPATPGGVDFRVVALAANGDGSSRGDVAEWDAFQWAFGCAAQSFYVDLDRDGYGAEHLGVKLGCEGDAAPTGYAALSGDCDENNETVHPNASEVCNRKDDDCNGEVDENAPAVTLWPDGDGDGYYKSSSATGTPETGCADLPGFAALSGDCDDTNPEVHPDATEVCNDRDEDCDGDVDDRARPQCGLGWCARYAYSCDPTDCEPGAPAVETCNSFDDDCDGVIDNDACPAGMACFDQQCAASGDEPGVTPETPVPVPGTDSSSPSESPPQDTTSAGGAESSPDAESSHGGAASQGAVSPENGASPPGSASTWPANSATGAPASAAGADSPGPSSSASPAPGCNVPSSATTERSGCSLAVAQSSSAARGMTHTAWLGLVTIAVGLCLRRSRTRQPRRPKGSR